MTSSSKKDPASPRESSLTPDRFADTFERRYPQIFSAQQSLLFTFAKGFVSGAGFSLAVAVAIPLLVLFISQFDWVPVIGRFVGDVTAWLEMGAN